MKQYYRQLLLILLLLSATPVYSTSDWSSATCPDAKIFGENLISGICWDCMFPVTLLGALPIGSGPKPPDAGNDPICTCAGDGGIPSIGVGLGNWAPARLIEIVRKPYCSPSLGGKTLMDSFGLWGGHKTLENDNSDKVFYQYHYFAFPLFQMLEILIAPGCQADGMIDFDLMFMSEIDPTWNEDELSVFMNPEAILFANPISLAACMGDCALASANILSDAFFWCAGCWGNLYPFTGNVASGNSPPAITSLLATRAVASLHRKGFARKTSGPAAQCGSYIYPTIPKSQYRLNQIYPLPEADPDLPLGCCHPVGASSFLWGEWRNIPGIGEDFVHMLWRYKDCCVRTQN